VKDHAAYLYDAIGLMKQLEDLQNRLGIRYLDLDIEDITFTGSVHFCLFLHVMLSVAQLMHNTCHICPSIRPSVRHTLALSQN